MNYLFAILLLVSLSACNQTKEDFSREANGNGNSGQGNNKPEASKRENKTNYQVCGTQTSTRTDITGRWEIFESQGDSHFKIALEFLPNQITLRQDCYLKGRRLTPEVTVQASYGDGSLQVLADGADTKKVTETGATYECKVNLIKNTSKYKFTGNCLELSGFQRRERLLFVPQ